MNILDIARFALNQNIDISPLPGGSANQDSIQTIINIASAIVGALSILFITIGGLRYIMSQGDPQAAAKAKGTIIGALIGIIIAITAQGIVIFVLGNF
jgi:hypothetical protein